MAATGTPTPNLGLRIPLGTDPASVDDINYNSNALDTIIGDVGETPVAGQLGAANNRISAVQAGLAIVCNGNTHAAIEAGQFAYVKNHGTLAEGLYRNNTGSTIAANATLSSSNLTADSSGGLNTVYDALNSNLESLMPKIQVGNSAYDINNLINGFVYWTAANKANVSNKPYDAAGSVFSIGYNNRIQQYYMNATTGIFYARYNAGGTWSNWKKLITNSDVDIEQDYYIKFRKNSDNRINIYLQPVNGEEGTMRLDFNGSTASFMSENADGTWNTLKTW